MILTAPNLWSKWLLEIYVAGLKHKHTLKGLHHTQQFFYMASLPK